MKRVMVIGIMIAAIVLLAGLAIAIVASPAPSPTSIQITAMPQSSASSTVEINGQTIRVTIADTEAARELGLGGRSGLAADEGMLFVFDHDDRYAFWMKDMRFSIDIVWIADDGTIVDFASNVSPDTFPHDFVPRSPARYVLELPAGYMQTHGVKRGDMAKI